MYLKNNENTYQRSAVGRFVFTTLFIIFCVSIPPGDFIRLFYFYVFIIILAFLLKFPVFSLFKKSLKFLPFILLISLFTLFTGADHREKMFLTVVARMYICINAVLLFSKTTDYHRLIQEFRNLKVPMIITDTADLFVRYLYITIDEVKAMRRALTVRGYNAKWIWQIRTLGDLAGVLFLRSYERSERVYQSMQSRLHSGGLSSKQAVYMQKTDVFELVSGVIFMSIIRFYL